MAQLASSTPLRHKQAHSRRWSRSVRHDLVNGLFFISPWLIGLLIFTLYPLVASFYYSFTDYNVLQPPKFIGVRNFSDMFGENHLFWTAVKNTLIFAIFSIPLNICFSICLALLLNVKVRG